MKFPGFHNPGGAQVNLSDGDSGCGGRTRDKDKGTIGRQKAEQKGRKCCWCQQAVSFWALLPRKRDAEN